MCTTHVSPTSEGSRGIYLIMSGNERGIESSDVLHWPLPWRHIRWYVIPDVTMTSGRRYVLPWRIWLTTSPQKATSLCLPLPCLSIRGATSPEFSGDLLNLRCFRGNLLISWNQFEFSWILLTFLNHMFQFPRYTFSFTRFNTAGLCTI